MLRMSNASVASSWRIKTVGSWSSLKESKIFRNKTRSSNKVRDEVVPSPQLRKGKRSCQQRGMTYNHSNRYQSRPDHPAACSANATWVHEPAPCATAWSNRTFQTRKAIPPSTNSKISNSSNTIIVCVAVNQMIRLHAAPPNSKGMSSQASFKDCLPCHPCGVDLIIVLRVVSEFS